MAPDATHTAPLVCKLRIRPLLLLVLGALCAIALAALGWGGVQAWRQLDTASWLSQTNRVAEHAMRLGAAAALERGHTAILLGAAAAPSSDSLEELRRRRAAVERDYRKLIEGAGALLRLADSPRLRSPRDQLSRHWSRISQRREAVDRWLTTRGGEPPEWFDSASRFIEAVGALRRAALTPIDPTGHAFRDSLLLKEAFHTVAEYAGRERGTLAGAIAEKRPLEARELEQLRHYRGIVEHALAMIDGELDQADGRGTATAARQRLSERFLGDYERLRQAVYGASATGTPYPLDAERWFSEATRAIDALLALSTAAGDRVAHSIETLRRDALRTAATMALSIALTLALFTAAFFTSYRRILLPLNRLERAADAIAGGDLERPVQVTARDEFGRLGETFERMRGNLLSDMAELRKLSQALDQSVSAVIITDAEGTVEYVNPQFTRTTGYRAEEIVGAKAGRCGSGRTPRSKYRELWATIQAGEVWQDELLNRRKDGELYWDQVAISPVRGEDGEITHFVSIQHDVTERKRMEERLHYVAYHDELTELPNRTLLADRFDQALERTRRTDQAMALLILDLDRFKLVNDSLGHSVGDQLLVTIAERLRGCARASDTVARYGGDEFVLLLPELDSPQGATDVALRILESVAQPMSMEGRELRPTASIGIAVWPQDGRDLETLLRNADAAMFRAKELGRNQLRFYTAELNGEAAGRLDLEHALRDAVEHEAFELHYQPQVDLTNGRLTGVEALIRWHRPGVGWVSPAEFIPLTEETGLIIPIGRWVLDRACAQLAAWRDQGRGQITMAVNVSPRQLERGDFPSTVAEALRRHDLPPKQLELELTEGAVMNNPDQALATLAVLKELGVQLALDDFGTGYSSLTYLHRFPFDKLKIDRAFVRNITREPSEAAIALTIGAMARSLRLRLIAEGVESEGQACYLRRHGCDQVQGYFYSAPLPGEEVTRLLSDEPFEPVGCRIDEQRPTVLWVGGETQQSLLREALDGTPVQLCSATSSDEGFDLLAIHQVQLLLHSTSPEDNHFLSRVAQLYPHIESHFLGEHQSLRPATLREEILQRLNPAN